MQRMPCKPTTKPELAWLDINNLVIDNEYQRPIVRNGWEQIKWIANNFNWNSFSPVLVSQVDNNTYAVIDGQHRVHAALLAGHDSVPALIVQATQAEQAAAFSRVNGNTTRVTPHTIYKAALAAKEHWAVESHRLVTAAGCQLPRSNKSTKNKLPGDILCIGLVKNMVENFEGNALEHGLRALRSSCFGDNIDVYNAVIIKPWLQSVASNSRYLQLDLANALNSYVDLLYINDQASKQAKETRTSRPAIMKKMICERLNKLLSR